MSNLLYYCCAPTWWPRCTITVPAALTGTHQPEIVKITGVLVKCYSTLEAAQKSFVAGQCIHLVEATQGLRGNGDVRFLVRKASNTQGECWSVRSYPAA